MNMLQHYELMYISPIKLDQKGQEDLLKRISDIITAEEGIITNQENWGNRRLGYEINHATNGFYVIVEFDVEPPSLKKIESSLKLNSEIIRYLIIKKKVKTEADIAKEKMAQEKIAKRKLASEKEKIEAETKKAEEKKVEEKKIKEKKASDKKISLDDLGKKLDEILKEEI